MKPKNDLHADLIHICDQVRDGESDGYWLLRTLLDRQEIILEELAAQHESIAALQRAAKGEG